MIFLVLFNFDYNTTIYEKQRSINSVMNYFLATQNGLR